MTDGEKKAPELGWLIERQDGGEGPSPEYHAIINGGEVWTRDHLQALRYARKQDAEASALRFYGQDNQHRIVEHMWS